MPWDKENLQERGRDGFDVGWLHALEPRFFGSSPLLFSSPSLLAYQQLTQTNIDDTLFTVILYTGSPASILG